MTKTIELKSQEDLDTWLAEKGESVRVINVAPSPKKWSLATGFFTNAKTYTVIYEEKSDLRAK
ncbi:MAG: hypothetical protein ABR567_09495 [Myxococcales bacterium]